MEALHDVVRAGKARYIGASSMYAWQFAKAQHTADTHGWTRFVSMQNHYNLVYREEEREMIPLCLDQGVGRHPVEPAGPRAARRHAASATASGAPSGRGSDPLADELYDDADFDVVDAVRDGRRRTRRCRPRRSRWPGCCTSPAVTAPIVGATKLGHLDDALAAVDLTLSEEEMARLEAPYRPHPVLGHS